VTQQVITRLINESRRVDCTSFNLSASETSDKRRESLRAEQSYELTNHRIIGMKQISRLPKREQIRFFPLEPLSRERNLQSAEPRIY